MLFTKNGLDNFMFEKNQQNVRKISQLVLGFCTVVFFVWFLSGQFAKAAQDGRDASKKLEMRQIEQAIILSELLYGEYPVNRNNPDWCEIGVRYGDRVCLYELTRDGFMGALPVSPDDHPYLYIDGGGAAVIATVFDDPDQIPQDQGCSINGFDAWCLKIRK